MPHRLVTALMLLFAAVCPRAQSGGDDDVRKAIPKDPYTDGDAAVMAAAGIVGYGPFRWADFTTADIDQELGEGRILWVETAHFRIGINLRAAALPAEQDKKKVLLEELRALHKVVPKIPEKPKKLDAWLRLHLYAQRLEKLYGDVQSLLGVTDASFGKGKEPPDGPYLGLPDKYLVLLFQKKSDLARYFKRFCKIERDMSMRWYHESTFQLLAGFSAEALDGYDDTALHGHVTYAVAHNLLNGFRGYYVALPLWLDEGLAHWFARKVPSGVVNVQILDTEAEPEDRFDAWPVKVRRRAMHPRVCFTFEQMAAWTKFEELGYHAHSQAWSRVDFLLAKDKDKIPLLVEGIKKMPRTPGQPVAPGEVAVFAQKLLAELYGLDAKAFDEQWRDWVVKTYPKK